MIQFEREAHLSVEDAHFEAVFLACLQAAGVDATCFLSLNLTSDEGIRAINRQWRGLDQSTDVLSFPSLALSPQSTFRPRSAQAQTVWDPELGAYFLGDLFISVPTLARQAAEFGHSLIREAGYLFAHGVLHLLGYDHLVKEEQSVMRELEEKALAAIPKPGDEALLQQAREARAFAHVPYSNYRVGAALLGKDGTVYTGCNIENASYGLTNCAERTAIFKAVSQGETRFEAIAIAADQTAPWPCGACRQVMSEFAPQLRVLITWGDGKTDSTTLDKLLPHSFLGFQEDTHGQ